MLPGPNPDRISIADVLQSCLESLTAGANRLALPQVHRAVVVLVDGLGVAALRARAGHARTLTAAVNSKAVIDTVFPTTTSVALATLTTGMPPGQHGLVGYSVLDTANDRVINQLSGWDERLDPATWQRSPTVFERTADAGFAAVAVGPSRYQDTGFTHAVLRGAAYRPAATIADRFEIATRWLREPGPAGLLYLYVPELDSTAHAKGWESPEWTAKLEDVDGEVRRLAASLRPADGLLVTADHGVIDVPAHSQVLFDRAPELLVGLRFVAGEPRGLQLHFEDGEADAGADRWRESESDRSWVVTRAEAIEAGWFGDVAPEVAPRIGDVIVAARKNVAYYDGRTAKASSLAMVGQHGSWSPAELQIPLLRYGAYAQTP
jgi:hypothetical protein